MNIDKKNSVYRCVSIISTFLFSCFFFFFFFFLNSKDEIDRHAFVLLFSSFVLSSGNKLVRRLRKKKRPCRRSIVNRCKFILERSSECLSVCSCGRVHVHVSLYVFESRVQVRLRLFVWRTKEHSHVPRQQ